MLDEVKTPVTILSFSLSLSLSLSLPLSLTQNISNLDHSAQVQWMAAPEQVSGCPPGLEYLTQIDQLLVNQQIELLEGKQTLLHHLNRIHNYIHIHVFTCVYSILWDMYRRLHTYTCAYKIMICTYMCRGECDLCFCNYMYLVEKTDTLAHHFVAAILKGGRQ